jgi:TP901 family phage tail tape measure protein
MQGDVRQMEYALGSVERKMGGLAGTIGSTGRTMSATGRAMTIGLTAPILAAGGAAVKAATDYETAFASVNKVLSDQDLADAGITLDQLSKSLREMAAGAEAIPIEGGVNTLAEIMAKGGALGIPTARLEEFTGTMAKLSLTADDISADQAATSFGHLNTALGFTEGQILATADAIVHLGNNGASTEGQILSMMSAIAGSAAIVGLSHDQTAAWAASMANVGEKAQAGGSSLSRYFQNVSDAVSGLDPDKMMTLVEVLDMSQASIEKMFKDDPNKLLTDFMVNLSKLDPSKWTSVLADMGLGDLLRRRGFTKMLNAMREGTQGSLVDMLQQVGEAGGEMEVEYRKRLETLAAQVQVIMQKLNEAAITLGEALIPIIKKDLLPILEEGVGMIQKFAEWFAKLPEPVRQTALKIGLLVAAAGPLMFIFGGLLQFLAPIVGLVTLLGRGIAGLIPGLGGLTGGKRGMAASMLGVQKVFVVNMPPGGIGGTGGPVAPGVPVGGWRGFLGGMMKGIGTTMAVAFVAYAGVEIGKMIGNHLIEGTVKPARDFETGKFETVLASDDANRIQNGIDVIKDQLNPDYWDLAGQAAMLLDAGGIRTTLESQLALLEEALLTADKTPGESTAEELRNINETVHDGWESTIEALPKLSTDEFLTGLAKTTEMGLAGVGTSIEQGITTGMDPLGDNFTRLAQRLENPMEPPALREISNHILGLEELQQTYLDTGDWRLAAKVQTNIDTLNRLIGQEDAHNASANALRSEAVTAANIMAQREAETRDATHALNMSEGTRFAVLGGQVYGISSHVDGVRGAVDAMHWTLMNKNFNPVIVNNNVVTAPGGAPITYAPGGGKQIGAPGHQSGAWNIRSNELAFLHAGEMVVPAKPAETWRQAMSSVHTTGGGGKEEHYHLEVDGLMRVQRPSELIRPMKHLARGKRLMQPGYGFKRG